MSAADAAVMKGDTGSGLTWFVARCGEWRVNCYELLRSATVPLLMYSVLLMGLCDLHEAWVCSVRYTRSSSSSSSSNG
jgi:hypothetical protein